MNPFLFAQTPPPGAGTSLFSLLPMFGIIIFIFYFIVYRPQQKEQKRRAELISNLKKGTKVVTAGGIHGIIAGIKDDTVLVKVAGDVKIEVTKSSISVVKNT